MRKPLSAFFLLLLFLSISFYLSARESYEDYRGPKDKYANKDKPLSEIRTGDSEDLMDDLRGAVRDEIDQSLSKERKASKKTINKDSLIKDVKKIVKEEIEDAIRIKDKKYLTKHTFEVGGFISFQSIGLAGTPVDTNLILKIFPVFNYFVIPNMALSFKATAEFNFTANTQAFDIGTGPLFAFGLDKKDEICFYTAIYIGMSMRSGSTAVGFRVTDEIGIKFVLTKGLVLSIGVGFAFDNSSVTVTGFQNLIIPAVGITGYF
jgi:hypothetical protein